MRRLVNWSVYYDDGTVWRAADGPWHKAPRDGVQALILHWDDAPKEIVMGMDEYRLPNRKHVKYGRWMPTLAFDALIERAMADG